MTWLPRFGLHLAAAVGATGIFVAAAAVGATQTRQAATQIVASPVVGAITRTPILPRRTPAPAAPGAATATPVVRPERSVTGTIVEVDADELLVQGPKGAQFRVMPVPGALIRLNGKAAKLDTLQAGDQVVILGQAQPRNGGFVAHAITARRK